MPYLLYYAGMAQDRVTEQIGLAISDDGESFKRAGSGLILPVNPKIPWKNLRTCNPTVLQEEGRFLMFYQGISAQHQVSIGVAKSTDGIEWQCEELPAITAESGSDLLASADHETTAVIEPAVIRENGRYRMWFISRGAKEPGNRLHHASSADGLAWEVDKADLVTGNIFGQDCRIHYPQVTIGNGGYAVDLSVRKPNGWFSVYRGFSHDGFSMSGWQELPYSNVRAPIWRRALNKFHITSCPYSHGLAHSHIVEGDPVQRVYFHAYHLDRQRRSYMDVVVMGLDAGARLTSVLQRCQERSAWDSFFVADPYVIRVS